MKKDKKTNNCQVKTTQKTNDRVTQLHEPH